MNPSSLSTRYDVRRITNAEIPAALRLMQSNPAFYRVCPPEPTAASVAFDLVHLPPRAVPEDKYFLGFWDGETLVALLDLILHYPTRQHAFFGFFMLDASRQGRGEAAAIVKETLAALRSEFSAVRLGVVIGNTRAERFWARCGFTPTGYIDRQDYYTVSVLEKTI